MLVGGENGFDPIEAEGRDGCAGFGGAPGGEGGDLGLEGGPLGFGELILGGSENGGDGGGVGTARAAGPAG